jgi:hypothetical protein
MSQSSPDQCPHTAANNISHTMPSGEVWTRCMRCGKTTRSAAEPMGGSENVNISSDVLNLAAEMGFRMGQSVAVLVAATADSHAALPTQSGGQTAHFSYGAGQEDCNTVETLSRRQKVIDEAGRYAAAAFDAGIEAERNPVELDGDRKLKAI